MPNVIEQFNALTPRPDPIGFYRGSSPDPTSCQHYQGMVRLQGADGTPYFIVSRSGNDLIFCVADDEPGNLLIVRMDSRDKNGERMRSNRLKRNTDMISTAPPAEDTTVNFISFNGENGWPRYGHPGGMQLTGDILVVALEIPYNAGDPEALFCFIDVSDIENPTLVNTFAPPEAGVHAGVVGITKEANGSYLMTLTGRDGDKLWFYRSIGPDAGNLRGDNLAWEFLDVWVADLGFDAGPGSTLIPRSSEDEVYLGAQWPSSSAHQTLQFLRDGGPNGTLYLAGARGRVLGGDDMMDLYRVDFDGAQVRLKHQSSQHKISHANADGSIFAPQDRQANFAAASTFYISPSGELIFYATEHDNDGPSDSVKAGEWRHIDMVRPGSPTLLPTVQLFGPYQVAEGGDTVLTGIARPPITRAWIQLFRHSHYEGRYIVVDFSDWGKDSFDNFKDLEGAYDDTSFGFNDVASSWRWFAPDGCSIRANDDVFGDSSFPGAHTLTLDGTGGPKRDPNLEGIPDNDGDDHVGDRISSVEFLANCAAYYSTTPDLLWDLDANGSFESAGLIVPFSAANLEGPGEIAIPVHAVHPLNSDTGQAIARVQIFNVPPAIGSFQLVDSLGMEIGANVPFALANLEYFW
ncbi:MAG: hypothetical protein ACXW3Z_13360 [Limisphaerales bacterium]